MGGHALPTTSDFVSLASSFQAGSQLNLTCSPTMDEGGIAAIRIYHGPPPAVPARSPLRTRSTTTSSSAGIPSSPALTIPDDAKPLDQLALESPTISLSESDGTPGLALSTSSASLRDDGVDHGDADEVVGRDATEDVTISVSLSQTEPLLAETPSTTSKRTHALIELLTSERVFASDLAVMRHVHIPLALGQPSHFQLPAPPTPTAPSLLNPTITSPPPPVIETAPPDRAPMTLEDVRIVFSNIEQLAEFADEFAGKIEKHMGEALNPDSEEKDSIGTLFLEVVSTLG